MGFRRAVRLATMLLVVGGFGLCVGGAAGQGAAMKRTTKSSASSASSSKSKTRKASSKKGRRTERGQQAPTVDRISEIQTALSKDRSYSGAPSGKWDDSTVAAMRNFQSTHGLNPSGKLDARTLEKLGLGSQTAGVAAPINPKNATSKLVSSNREPSSPQ
jgi:peptidoglycan hydrolase-like protein with peptidoglycan-binding domain